MEALANLFSKYMSMAIAFMMMDTNLGRVGVALRNFLAWSVKIMVDKKLPRYVQLA